MCGDVKVVFLAHTHMLLFSKMRKGANAQKKKSLLRLPVIGLNTYVLRVAPEKKKKKTKKTKKQKKHKKKTKKEHKNKIRIQI